METPPPFKAKEVKTKEPEVKSNHCSKMLSEQVNHEMTNSLFYQCCQNYCDSEGFFTAAEYFDKQSVEEREHSLKVFKYMQGRDIAFTGYELDVNPKFTSLVDVINQSYDKEVSTTKALKEIRDYANKEGDSLTEMIMLDMLVEQIQEEATVKDLKSKAKGLNPNNKMEMLHLEEQFEG